MSISSEAYPLIMAGQNLMGQSPNYVFNPASKPGALESHGKVIISDLIGEGPIAGVCDNEGGIVTDFDESRPFSLNTFKGVYYNDVPVMTTRGDSINYPNALAIFKKGTQFQEAINQDKDLTSPIFNDSFSYANASVIYEINKPLYPLATAIEGLSLDLGEDRKHKFAPRRSPEWDDVFRKAFNPATFQECFGVYHEVQDQGVSFLVVNMQIDTMYKLDDEGNMYDKSQYFGYEFGYREAGGQKFGIIHKVKGKCTSPYRFSLYFDISDFEKSLRPYIKIYNLSEKIEITDTKNTRKASVANICEVQNSRLSYPNSCYIVNEFDGRSFTNVPSRSYDLKLLKIKIPYNYDAEAKKYYGPWMGDFDPILRWCNNPAWVMYDIITNNRYGLAKYSKDTVFLNKWTAFQMSKYCDELVITENRSRYAPIKVCKIVDRNTICLTFTRAEQLLVGRDLKKIFGQDDNEYEIALMNLKFYDPVSQTYYYKCFRGIITYVDELKNEIHLCNDFGIEKMASIFPARWGLYVESSKKNGVSAGVIKDILASAAKRYSAGFQVVTDFLKGISNESLLSDVDTEELTFFTQDEVDYYVPNSGTAACEFTRRGFPQLVEPRFTTNLYLQSQAQAIDLINDMATVFRGMVYWNNLSINFASDRKQLPVYAFSNASVKDGIFSYSGSNKDNIYTVSKVVFSNKDENFRDYTVYVEDLRSVRNYGYIEREIIGFGITSISQAKRIGKWFLLTNQLERESVRFVAGQEALLLNIGDIITISDAFKVNGQRSGRIKNYTTDGTYTLTLDNKYDFISPNDKISVVIISETLGKVKDIYSEEAKTRFVYDFIVDEVELVASDSDFRTSITLNVQTEKDKIAYGDIMINGVWYYEEKYQSDLKYNKQYRIIGIKELEDDSFELTGLDYAYSKFDHLDFNAQLEEPTLVAGSPELETNLNDYAITELFSSISQNTFFTNDRFLDQDYNGLVDTLLEALCPEKELSFIYKTEEGERYEYDYIFTSSTATTEFLSFYGAIFYPAKLLETYELRVGFNEGIKGFIVEVVLNYKKVSFKWEKGDEKEEFRIAYPIDEYVDSTFDIRVYKLGENQKILT